MSSRGGGHGVPVSGTQDLKSTPHISLHEELVKKVRETAYRKRRHTSHVCRDFIEAGVKKLVAEDPVAAGAVASVNATKQGEAAGAAATRGRSGK